jgi:hypothetical protein
VKKAGNHHALSPSEKYGLSFNEEAAPFDAIYSSRHQPRSTVADPAG